MEEGRLTKFGSYLVKLRHRAGYRSQDSALEAARQKFQGKKVFSKSMLSLFERGEIMTAKPEVLKLLAELYEVEYDELAERWFEERYNVKGFYKARDEQFIKQANPQRALLHVDNEDEDISIISIQHFEKLQSELPKGTEVGVVSSEFLDNTILFPMVSKNISRGVIYQYLYPDESRVTYQTFITRIEELYPKLHGKVDGKLAHFVSRPNLDFPMNYVVYLYPSGKIEGFIGLLRNNWPALFSGCWATT